jgi:hypothetical protein
VTVTVLAAPPLLHSDCASVAPFGEPRPVAMS